MAAKFDLEERTEKFAKEARSFVKKLPRTLSNFEDVKQLVRASGSVAANYIEANEALSKKDFFFRIKICRKESKEARLFLRLLDLKNDQNLKADADKLVLEASEFILIFNHILKSDSSNKKGNSD